MNAEARRQIIEALHPSRMKPYMDASNGNQKQAIALYRWHSELSASVHEILGITEVVLRNSMDRQLQEWNDLQLQLTGGSWLLSEPATPLRSLSAKKRQLAKKWAELAVQKRSSGHPRFGDPVEHDDVLAQVSFGLWKDLLPNHLLNAGNNQANRNRNRLWDEALQNAFPEGNDSSGELTFWRVSHVHHLRNRISHMEPLLKINVKEEVQMAFDLLLSINSTVAAWVTGGSRVSSVIASCPADDLFNK